MNGNKKERYIVCYINRAAFHQEKDTNATKEGLKTPGLESKQEIFYCETFKMIGYTPLMAFLYKTFF